MADTLSMFDDSLHITAGGRQQSVQIETFNRNTGQRVSNNESEALTPFFGVLYKLHSQLSVYANYIQGLTQGPIAPVTAVNAGEIFSPVVTRQYEAGVKYDFGSVMVTAAYFNIGQPSAFLNPTTNRFGVDGLQRNQGVELNGYGQINNVARILGGITFMDGELVKTAGRINDGHTAPGVPRWATTLYGEYDLPFLEGLTATGQVIYVGRQFVNQANTQSIPAYASPHYS